MAKKMDIWQCNYCDKQLTTEAGINRHEDKCTANPVIIQAKSNMSGVGKEIDDIRLNATSPSDLFNRIEDFLSSKGIEVSFTAYPTKYNNLVSNSHDSPKGYRQNWCGRADDEGVPKGYPGWSGNLIGLVTVTDRSILNLKENFPKKLSDIWGGWSDSLFKFPYINTCNQNCKIYIYDFPKMHEKFKLGGKELTVKADKFNTHIQNYNDEFVRERNKHTENTNSFRTSARKITELEDILKKMRDLHGDIISKHNVDFADKYSVKVPILTETFINDELYSTMKNNISSHDVSKYKYLEDQYKYMDIALDDYIEYINDNSEVFV